MAHELVAPFHPANAIASDPPPQPPAIKLDYHRHHRRDTTNSTQMLCIAAIVPPYAIFRLYGCSGEFAFCLLLTLFGFLPGAVYAMVAVRKHALIPRDRKRRGSRKRSVMSAGSGDGKMDASEKGFEGDGRGGRNANQEKQYFPDMKLPRKPSATLTVPSSTPDTNDGVRKMSMFGFRANGRRPSASGSAFAPPPPRRPSLSTANAAAHTIPGRPRAATAPSNRRSSVIRALSAPAVPPASPNDVDGDDTAMANYGPGLDPILEDVVITESEEGSILDEGDEERVGNEEEDVETVVVGDMD